MDRPHSYPSSQCEQEHLLDFLNEIPGAITPSYIWTFLMGSTGTPSLLIPISMIIYCGVFSIIYYSKSGAIAYVVTPLS
jgi:hypothetical protein